MTSVPSWLLRKHLKQAAATGYLRTTTFANFSHRLIPTSSTWWASQAVASLQLLLGCSRPAAPGPLSSIPFFSHSIASLKPRPHGVPYSINFSISTGLQPTSSTGPSRMKTRVHDGKANIPRRLFGHFPDFATSSNRLSAGSQIPSGHCTLSMHSMSVRRISLGFLDPLSKFCKLDPLRGSNFCFSVVHLRRHLWTTFLLLWEDCSAS